MLSRTVNDREATAERLLQSSLDHSSDQLQRESMRDETVQPLTRMVNDRFLTAVIAYVVARNLVHPDVYKSVGIDPDVGRRAALANPHWQETSRWSARKLVPFLREQELIGGTWEFLWRRARLV